MARSLRFRWVSMLRPGPKRCRHKTATVRARSTMEAGMASHAAFAETATLAGDPARAVMLHALMDGRALTASELAQAAGITPQTASGHLSKLAAGGLLTVEKQGRHRYH